MTGSTHAERRRDVVRHRHWQVIAPYLLVVLAAFGGIVSLQASRDQACRQRAADRLVLTKVVDIATTPSDGPVDLSQIAGFDTLDPSTQNYLRNLSAALTSANPPGGKSLHDQLLELLPPITC